MQNAYEETHQALARTHRPIADANTREPEIGVSWGFCLSNGLDTFAWNRHLASLTARELSYARSIQGRPKGTTAGWRRIMNRLSASTEKLESWRAIITHWFLPAAFALIVCCSLSAVAQTSMSTIRGVVTDTSGALVPGAPVTLLNTKTNHVVREVVTDSHGLYEIDDIIGGNYRLTVTKAGFKLSAVTGIFLASSQTERVDIVLQVGSATTTVTVSGASRVIQTEGGGLGATVTGKTYQSLPTPANSYSSPLPVLAAMPLLQFDKENAYNPTMAGQGGNQFNMSMNGIAQETVITQTSNMENVAELRMTGVDNSAQYSRIATYDLVTKSGTSKFHGRLEYYLRNSALGASGYFDVTKQPIIYNTMTAEASGPMGHHTFFYGMWNGERVAQHTATLTTVPTELMRAGNFSQLLNQPNPTIITNPATGTPYPGNIIPASQLDTSAASAVSLATQADYIPVPNLGGTDALFSNYEFVWPYPADQYDANVYVARIDHTFSDKDSMFGTFSSYFPDYILAGNYPAFGSSRTRKSYSWSLNETHIFSPDLVNTFAFGGNYDWNENGQKLNGFTSINGADAVSTIGLQGVNSTSLSGEGFPVMNISGLSSFRTVEVGGTNIDGRNFSYNDNVTWVKGQHVTKFGAQVRTYYTWSGSVPNGTYGRFSFDGRFTGYPYADFLLGLPATSTRFTPIVNRSQSAYEMGYYITDTFKVTPKLTLTYGLRWDYFGQPTFGDGLQYNWDAKTGDIIVPRASLSKVSPLYPKDITVVAGNPVPSPDNLNFVPRFAAAYLINKNTVIRGGYGIFNEALGPFTLSQEQGTGPFELSETYTNAMQDGHPIFSFPNPFPGTQGEAPSQSPTGFQHNTTNGKIQQWNLTVERQLGSVGLRASYVGSWGSGLHYFINTDMPQPSTTPFSTDLMPYPQFVSNNYLRHNGRSEYNALSVEAQRRVGQIIFDWNWTWASNLDTMENLQNPYAPLPWNHDTLTAHHNVVMREVWNIPVGRGRQFGNQLPKGADEVLGGWNLAWISYFQTGQWFSPTISGVDTSNTNTFSSVPDRICNGNYAPGKRRISGWFNTSCFVVPPNGRFGDSGMNILEGPGLDNQSGSLSKAFPLVENISLTFSLMASNVFNHPNFLNPTSNDVTVPGAGAINTVPDYYSPVKAGPRIVEGRLALSF